MTGFELAVQVPRKEYIADIASVAKDIIVNFAMVRSGG
jgi:hypothetical protein